jgi:hypothetical protein
LEAVPLTQTPQFLRRGVCGTYGDYSPACVRQTYYLHVPGLDEPDLMKRLEENR